VNYCKECRNELKLTTKFCTQCGKKIHSKTDNFDNNKYEFSFINDGIVKSSISFIKQKKRSVDPNIFEGNTITNIQKIEPISFSPNGTWKVYNDKNQITLLIDFESKKPKNIITPKNEKLEFDPYVIEVIKFKTKIHQTNYLKILKSFDPVIILNLKNNLFNPDFVEEIKINPLDIQLNEKPFENCNIRELNVNINSDVDEGDFLCEVETDQSTIDVFSPCKGRVLFVNHKFNIDNTLLVVIEKKQLSDVEKNNVINFYSLSNQIGSNEYLSEKKHESISNFYNIIDVVDLWIYNLESLVSSTVIENLEKQSLDWVEGISHTYNIDFNDPVFCIPIDISKSYEKYTLDHPLLGKYDYHPSSFMINFLSKNDMMNFLSQFLTIHNCLNDYEILEGGDYKIDFSLKTHIYYIKIWKKVKSFMDFGLKKLDVFVHTVEVTLQPPKQLNNDSKRGIHQDSKYINDLFPKLNSNIYRNCEGGVSDGRFFVLSDNRSDIILSTNEDFSFEKFKSLIDYFQLENDFLTKNIDRIKSIIDISCHFNSTKNTLSYNPKFINYKKEDSQLCIEIKNKCLISYNNLFGLYQFRIDKISNKNWNEIRFIDNDIIELYVNPDINFELNNSQLREIKSHIETFTKEMVDGIIDIDLEVDKDLFYWYNIIRERTYSNISQLDNNKKKIDVLGENIWSHCDEYFKRYKNEEYSIKKNSMKLRVVAFGSILTSLENLMKLIYNTVNLKQEDPFPSKNNLIREIIHCKASLYGAIKYSIMIGVDKDDIKKWYKGFKDDDEFIKGKNPYNKLIPNENFHSYYELSSSNKNKVDEFKLFINDQDFQGPFKINEESHFINGKEIKLNFLESTLIFRILTIKKILDKGEMEENEFVFKHIGDEKLIKKIIEWFKINRKDHFKEILEIIKLKKNT